MECTCNLYICTKRILWNSGYLFFLITNNNKASLITLFVCFFGKLCGEGDLCLSAVMKNQNQNRTGWESQDMKLQVKSLLTQNTCLRLTESLGLETKTESLPFKGRYLQTSSLWGSFWYPGVTFNGFVNSVDIWNKNQQLVVIFLLYILIDKLHTDLKSIRIRMIHTELELRDLYGLLFPRKPRLLCVKTVSWESVNSRRLYLELHLEMKTLIFPKYIIIVAYTFVYLCFWK